MRSERGRAGAARLLALFAVLLLAARGAAAETLRITQPGAHDIEVTAEKGWPTILNKGWFPLRMELRNLGEGTSTVELEGTAGYRLERRVRRVFELEAGARIEFELLLPLATQDQSDYRFEVKVDGGEASELSGDLGSQGCVFPELRSVVVFGPDPVSQSRVEAWSEALNDGYAKLGQTGGGGMSWFGAGVRSQPGVSLAGATFADMPQRYQAYTSLDFVVLDARKALPAARELEPLVSWLRLGGTVLVYGGQLQSRLATDALLGPCIAERFVQEDGRWTSYAVGFGRLILDESQSADYLERDSTKQRVQELLAAPRRNFVPNPEHPWVAGLVAPFRIPGIGELPFRTFALLLVVFAVLIGPVNFIIVKRRGRPGLLLLTIPGIALVASVAFLAYGVIYQGLDVKLASRSLTFLDQRLHRSATIEERAMFAGMSPSAGLLPAAGTTCLSFELAGRIENRLRYELNREQGGGDLLAGDFLPIRRTTHQVFLSERASRLRLGLVSEGGGLVAENALDAEVLELLVRAESGQWYVLDGALPAGERAPLLPVPAGDGEAAADLILKPRPERLAPDIEGLWRGSYVARLGTSPFVDDCGIESTRSELGHVLIGVLDAEEAR